MSQIGILTPTQPDDDTPHKWVKKHQARRLVKRALITMISKDRAREIVKGTADSDSQRFNKTALPAVVRMQRLPIRDWRQSLDLCYPERGRESNWRQLRADAWKRAYPETLTEVHPKVLNAEK